MTKLNKTFLIILLVLLLILGILVSLVLYASRSDDSATSADGTTASEEQKPHDPAGTEDAQITEATENADETGGAESSTPTSSDEKPSGDAKGFDGIYEGTIKWPPGADGTDTTIGVTFTENSTTLTTGRDSRALKIDQDAKQTDTERVYKEAAVLSFGPANITWTFTATDEGMKVHYVTSSRDRADADLKPAG